MKKQDPISSGFDMGTAMFNFFNNLIPSEEIRKRRQANRLLKRLRKQAKQNGVTLEQEIELYNKLLNL